MRNTHRTWSDSLHRRWLPAGLLPLVLIGSIVLSDNLASAAIKLPTVLSDHMVLQRNQSVPIWGQASPGDQVTVKFRQQQKEATAGADGNWRVALDSLEAGGPDTLTISAGTETTTLEDVLVGEVWVGSGQSNMQGAAGSYAVNDPVLSSSLSAAPYPQIRLVAGKTPWKEATEANLKGFSALLFSFGLSLHKDLKVPIGLMQGAVGGTPSGAWVSQQALADDEACQKLIAAYAAGYDNRMKQYATQLATWQKAAEEAKKNGQNPPPQPPSPGQPGTVRNQTPGYLYEAHIRHFIPFGIRGVLWDQGESGTQVSGVEDQYTLMGALIRGWRKEWGQPDFPFIYVQKPSGGGCAWDPQNPVTNKAEAFAALPAAVPELNDGQYVETHVNIMNYPHTGMAISSDLGSGVHPTNKSGYGQRAATVALGMVYEKPVEYYGPVYKSHAVEGDAVKIDFTHVGQGLAFRHGEKLQGFAVAGDDRKFHWAEAQIEGNQVVVRSSDVTKPVAVRYAYSRRHNWANLFNRDGLPAVPFRTDTW